MPFTALAASGIVYSLNPASDAVLVGSTVTATASTDAGWYLSVPDGTVLRATFTSYSGGTGGGTINVPNSLYWDAATQVNLSAGVSLPLTAFTPSPVTTSAILDGVTGLNYAHLDVNPPTEGPVWSGETYAILIEVETADVPPICDEVGYSTKANVSAYSGRSFTARMIRGQTRCLVANFNGAIAADRSIVSAIWRCDQYNAVVMSAIQADSRKSSVLIATPNSGCARLKCEVTLDNGEVYNQLFNVAVKGSPYFTGETLVSGSGPSVLSVTV